MVTSSSDSSNSEDNQTNNGSWFFLGPKKAYAFDLKDGMLVAAMQSSGELELILDFEGAESGEVIKDTTVLLINPGTGKGRI